MEQIVIVDDNADLRGCIGDFLRGAGYQVHEAANGSTVIDLLERNPVDLVITDVVMPIKEGIETICDIKRLFPGIKVIATSGYDYYLAMAGKLGADRTFEKPFDIEKLLVAIRALLGSERFDHPIMGAPDYHRYGGDTSALYTTGVWREAI